jgi:mannosyltransferase
MTRTLERSGQRRGPGGGARLAALSRVAAPGGAVRRVIGSVWIWPMTVMAALGWYRIGGAIMWRDELATWSASARSVPQLWRMVHHIDAVLGVYYFGMHFWIALFGDSPTAMRVPSLIAMTGAAGLVALTGRRLGGYPAGLSGGLVFALIPSVSRYAQDARPYAFATFFAALATLLLLRALERPDWRRWLPYALAVAAAGASNLLALALIAGHAVAAALHCWRSAEGGGRRRNVAGGFCLSAVAAVILDSPIIVEGHKQTAEQIGTLLQPPLSQLTGLNGSLGVWPELFCSTAVALAVILLAVASLAGPSRRASMYCLASAFLPIAVIWGASQGSTSYWSARYLLFTVPAFSAAAGLAIAGAGRLAAGLRGRRLAAVPVVAGVVLVAVIGWPDQQAIRHAEAHNWWSYPNPVGDIPADYAGAANVIAANELPGDGIVFQVSDHNHWMVDNGVDYYLRLEHRPIPVDVFLAKTPAQAGGLQPVECADPARCLRGEPRLWLVYVNHLVPGGRYRDPYAAIGPGQAAVLRARHYVTARRYEEDGITVALMLPRAVPHG